MAAKSSSGRTLCKGCQEFEDSLLNLYNPEVYEPHDFPIHDSYSELSKCAATCDLCKFFRREVWLITTNPPSRRYMFNDPDLEPPDGAIKIKLHRPSAPGRNQFYEICKLLIGDTYHAPIPLYLTQRDDEINIRNRNSGFEQLLEWPRRWLTVCRTKHNICGLQVTDLPTFLPTRLLDVGLPEQESIRLVLSKDLKYNQHTEYMTLSYCWGETKDAVCTTKDNIAERLKAIATDSLPQTLQDAVVITRGLGVRYLWIDALCIIQTQHAENEDWQRELPNMGKIYRHSLLTIAASSAQDSSVGMFNYRKCARWPVQDYSIPIPNDPGMADDADAALVLDDALVLKATRPDWEIVVENSPLSQRGWVMQERMLASRTLFWTAEGLFWQCGKLDDSEHSNFRKPQEQMYPKLPTLVEGIKQAYSWEKSSDDWITILETFSSKTLTVATDRLPALTGLGMEIARLTGREYEMGVFKHSLVRELAWATGFNSPHVISNSPPAARIPCVPSWSWASVNQVLTFRTCQSLSLNDLFLKPYIDNHQLCGRGRLGTLGVKRASKSFASRPDTVYYPTFEPIRPRTIDPTDTEDYSGDFAAFDTLEDTIPSNSGSIRCLQWASWMVWRNCFFHDNGELRHYLKTGALIVSPVDEQKNIYRRIGWLEVINADFFEDELRDITLV